MAVFDTLIGDTAGRFGLGANAGPLVRETLNMITNSPGGIGGFLGKLKSSGLGPEMESWLGHPDAAAIPAQELERALGAETFDGIANKLGIGESAVSSAVGYTLPKLIGALTPGGKVPASLPSEVASFLAPRFEPSERWAAPRTARVVEQRVTERVAPQRINVIHDESHLDEPHMARWLWPLLGSLAVLGLGTYLFTRANRPVTPVAVQQPVVQQHALPVPALAPRLTLSNDGGVIHYSGSVHDEETRASIINSLKAVFGADRIQGDIGIDLNRGAAPWLANFRTALETVKAPGLQTEFDGNSINLGGIVSDAERDRISNSLKSVLGGGGLVFGTLSDKVNDVVSGANAKAAAALTSLRTGFNANDLTGILNQSIINFPAGGAEIPSAVTPLLRDAAAQIKQLPPGTVLEIAGHTDNTGDAAANIALSQQRADAVRNLLIQAGVEPSMLVAKGYGSASPIGSNELLEGRFRNRRIEYRVLKS